jgi:MtN3 and saliva related transmembrane protein
MIELIGWFTAAVLLATIGRQVYSATAAPKVCRGGSSSATASAAFVIYSWLLGNWVFVVTNVLMLATAVVGECVNRRTSAAVSGRDRWRRPIRACRWIDELWRASNTDSHRQLGNYVGRILAGATPRSCRSNDRLGLTCSSISKPRNRSV